MVADNIKANNNIYTFFMVEYFRKNVEIKNARNCESIPEWIRKTIQAVATRMVKFLI